MSRLITAILTCTLLTALAACNFTGVESTAKVTENDVNRVIRELDRRQPQTTLEVFADSVPVWKIGKRFYVTDAQVRHILISQNPDTTDLTGKTLTYDGYELGSLLDNRQTVNLRFRLDGSQTVYLYRTDKTLGEFSSSFSIPLLIDMDMVDHIARQLVGQVFFIKTRIWYNPADGQMDAGRQFIPVKITSVGPGNKALPLRVAFTTTDTNENAFVWMSSPGREMAGRDFDAMFSRKNIHDSYPDISDGTWKRITLGQVAPDMTKDECRLALGMPKTINRIPDQAGLREYWLYDGGKYLFFVDGLLRGSSQNFR